MSTAHTDHPAKTTETTETGETVRIQSHYATTKKLGNWTTAHRFEVRSRRGHVVLDLRSPQITARDIDIEVDLDHAMIKLLLPQDATVDDWDLKFLGRGKVKDSEAPRHTGVEPTRRVRLRGEIRHGEVRVNRGGIAQLAAMFTREYVRDVRRAHKMGGVPTVDDPARSATDPNGKPYNPART